MAGWKELLRGDPRVAAGVERGGNLLPTMIRTANGTVQAETGTIRQLELGGIEARDLKVVVSPSLGARLRMVSTSAGTVVARPWLGRQVGNRRDISRCGQGVRCWFAPRSKRRAARPTGP